jgi:DNA-binding MarR family transcriptional regulator
LEKIKDTIFYALERSIKSYRQFAQRNLNNYVDDITIDQWLVLKTLHESPDINQKELAQSVFKDYASITRIIDLLVQRNYLSRETHPKDRRRYLLRLTPYAENKLETLFQIVKQNRTTALEGVSKKEIDQLHEILEKITINCQLKSNTYESKNMHSA